MPNWTTLYVMLFWWLLLPCSFVVAWWWGDRVLRFAFTCYSVLVVVGNLVLQRTMYRSFEHFQAITDLILWSVLTWLAVRYRRWWLIVAASLQLVACLGHVAKVIYHPSRLGYALMTGIGGYPILVTLLIGLFVHIRSRSTRSPHRASGSLDGIQAR